VSKKSKTPIQFQQQENTPRRQHEAIIQEGTQQERARKKTRRDRKRQTEDSLKSPLTVSLSVCLARDDEEEEEEEKKYISAKKGGFERKRNCDSSSSSSSSHNSLTFQRERKEYYRPGVYHRQVVVRGILRHDGCFRCFVYKIKLFSLLL
jgi:hypothetical protein